MRLDGSLVWPKPIAQAMYFTGKVPRLVNSTKNAKLFHLRLAIYDIGLLYGN